MRRRVFYDAGAHAAAAAASLVHDEFDLEPIPPAGLGHDPADVVVLVAGSGEAVPPGERVRVVGLVDPTADPNCPDAWYTVLPAGVTPTILARTLHNAFRDLDAAHEVMRLDRELSELNAIGIQLTAERDPKVLLQTILRKAREITLSDAGSLYLVEDDPDGARQLRFVLAQNDSLPVPYETATMPLTRDSVAGYVALEGVVLNVADAYALPPGATFSINRSFDDQLGYRTKSMLVVPMRTPKGETIGVLQLINCKPHFAQRLESREDVERLVGPFGARYEKLAASLASQAAVALDNSRLYQSIHQLFEGFVQASVTAIESRDPTTSGHSSRVAALTVGLAEAVDRCGRGPYAIVRFTHDEIMEIRYAALLHDFGKVGVREQVLVKAKKLYPGELERIRQRVEIIKRGLELRYAGRKLEHLLEKGRDRYAEQAAMLDAELMAYLADLDDSLDRIVNANEPSVLPQEVAHEIERLARQSFEDHRGHRQTVVTPEEASALGIPRGSLTPSEYQQIQSHVVHTFQFLAQIPWTKEFRRIPEIARSHHEKLNGRGYPYGMKADEIPVQSKIMTIADIYDALMALDRPYKRAVPVERALDILREEQRAGGIDGDLLDLFVGAKIYERTSRG